MDQNVVESSEEELKVGREVCRHQVLMPSQDFLWHTSQSQPFHESSPLAAHPECCKCIGANFEITLVDPIEKVPEHPVAFLREVGL